MTTISIPLRSMEFILNSHKEQFRELIDKIFDEITEKISGINIFFVYAEPTILHKQGEQQLKGFIKKLSVDLNDMGIYSETIQLSCNYEAKKRRILCNYLDMLENSYILLFGSQSLAKLNISENIIVKNELLLVNRLLQQTNRVRLVSLVETTENIFPAMLNDVNNTCKLLWKERQYLDILSEVLKETANIELEQNPSWQDFKGKIKRNVTNTLSQLQNLPSKYSLRMVNSESPRLFHEEYIGNKIQGKSREMQQDLEQIKACVDNNPSAEATFKALAQRGYTWPAIKHACLFDKKLDASARRLGAQLVETLIERREALDEQLYTKAIELLFPKNNHFTVQVKANGDLKKGGIGFKIKYYEFWVFDKYISAKTINSEAEPHATIAIKAPGSRDVTSDIDTTIHVTGIQQISLSAACWPEAWGAIENHDVEVLVQAALITYFNSLNQQLIGITAGESRDSNVYSEGFLHPKGYPKFTRYELSFDDQLKIDFDTLYAPYKQKKQQQELGASLCSLREYYANKDENWDQLLADLMTQWEDKHDDNATREAFIQSITQAFSLANGYWEYKERHLSSEVKQLQQEVSPLTGNALKRDSAVAAMNKLYQFELLQVASKYYAVAKTEQKVQSDIKALMEQLKEIEEQQGIVKDAQKRYRKVGSDRSRDKLEKEQKELSELTDKAQKLRGSIKKGITELADYINEQQDAQIKANLFANEAYVNRSAPYHVVQWLQSQDDRITIAKKQVVMGSVLQQIGFRLLHAHELRRAGIEEGQVLYSVAKYGLRVADMVFGGSNHYFNDQLFTSEELHLIRQGKPYHPDKTSIPILSRLKDDYYKDFEKSEYNLINQDTDFVVNVKKQESVRLHEKASKAENLLRTWIFKQHNPNRQEISAHDIASVKPNQFLAKISKDEASWLALARKIIILTYTSKLEQTQQLWGGSQPGPVISSESITNSELSSVQLLRIVEHSLKQPSAYDYTTVINQQAGFNIGESDFKQQLQGGRKLVDKSLFIKELVDDGSAVKLIIRPRRFCKTSNISMLYYYFNMTESNKHLFQSLAIWQQGERYQKEQGRYPVIFLTFKEIKAKTYSKAYLGLKTLIASEYKTFKPLLFKGLDDDEKKLYQAIIDKQADDIEVEQALKQLTQYLYNHYQQKVIILIDEYDTPIQASYTYHYYDEMADFMRGFLSAALKDNAYLQQAVLTGILRVAKESIFSGLNNLRVYSALSEQYSQWFGFTESEVQELMGEHVTPDIRQQVEAWYGGYHIGKVQVYNPWSVINFIQNNQQTLSSVL